MNPLRPAFKTSCKFIPKPSATTEHCRSVRATPRLSLMYGCVKLRPKRIPTVSAIGGENNPVNASANATTKIIFAKGCIDWEKGIRRQPSEASAVLNLPKKRRSHKFHGAISRERRWRGRQQEHPFPRISYRSRHSRIFLWRPPRCPPSHPFQQSAAL